MTKGRVMAATLAISMAASFGSYEFLKPVAVRASVAAPASAPLGDDSVGALLSLDQAMETLAAHVTPAVVNVTVTARTKAKAMQLPEGFEQFFGKNFGGGNFGQNMQPQVEHGLGSGIIISPDGYIVTNNHVVQDAVDIRVTMNDRRVLPAKLIGADPLTDLAVIKINGSNFASAPWGDSAVLKPGQTVLAFGNPFGFRFTVTRGIVSGLNRANPFTDDSRKPGEFIQTDAAINPGNSGGPLVNARGEVVGINTFLISQTGTFNGMGFAIPTQVARPTVQTLIRDGKVSHGYMGIGITDVTPENAQFFHMSDMEGAVVTEVQPDSPGAKAGLKVGDVIAKLNGHAVSGAGQLQVSVGQERPGTKINLDVVRDGKNIAVPVTLVEMGKRPGEIASNAGEEHGKPRWGISLADLTSDVREELEAPKEVHGAVVTNVVPGSPADNAGLSRGNVILEVNRKPVENAADVKRSLSSVPDGQDVMVLIWSNGGSTFRVLHAAEGMASSGSDSGNE